MTDRRLIEDYIPIREISAEASREQRIQQIAYDIHEHYLSTCRGFGLKAQLAASSKAEALLYQRFLDEFGGITAEVVISPPDLHEGDEAADDATTPQVAAFWKRMMERFGSEEKYNTDIKAAFSRPDGVDILIVVDKLLTGFDEPRNAVLYIDKPLKEHALLQAIARVNRLHDGKEHGLIVDYRGVLGELNTALNIYNKDYAYQEACMENNQENEYEQNPLLAALRDEPAVWDLEELEEFDEALPTNEEALTLIAHNPKLLAIKKRPELYTMHPDVQAPAKAKRIAILRVVKFKIAWGKRKLPDQILGDVAGEFAVSNRQVQRWMNNYIAYRHVYPASPGAEVFLALCPGPEQNQQFTDDQEDVLLYAIAVRQRFMRSAIGKDRRREEPFSVLDVYKFAKSVFDRLGQQFPAYRLTSGR